MDPIPYLSPDRARRAAGALVVLLVTLIVLTAALLVAELFHKHFGKAVLIPRMEPIQNPLGGDPMEPEPVSLAKYEPIVARNLFGTRTPKKVAQPGSSPIDPPGGALEESRLKVCLLGTVAGNPDESLAIVQDKATKEVKVVGPGDLLAEGVYVIGIDARRIVIDNRGRMEQVSMDESCKLPSQPRPPTKFAPPNVDDHDGITRQSATAFEIEREYLDRQLSNLNELITQARVIPHVESGRVMGFKIFEIKPNSLYRRLGLRDGDVMRAVNGRALTSPDKVFQLLQDLRYESRFAMWIMRGDENLEMEYRIR